MASSKIPSRERLKRQAEVFSALGHASRMAIVHGLGDGPVCALDLAEIAGCSPSTTSRHLLVLRHAGLIEDERRGKQIFYHLTYPCVLTFAKCVEHVDAGLSPKAIKFSC